MCPLWWIKLTRSFASSKTLPAVSTATKQFPSFFIVCKIVSEKEEDLEQQWYWENWLIHADSWQSFFCKFVRYLNSQKSYYLHSSDKLVPGFRIGFMVFCREFGSSLNIQKLDVVLSFDVTIQMEASNTLVEFFTVTTQTKEAESTQFQGCLKHIM